MQLPVLFVDDILGRPSTGNVFRQAFSDVASRYNVDTLEGRRLLNDMLDDAFSTGAAFDRNITDIISALTMNAASMSSPGSLKSTGRAT